MIRVIIACSVIASCACAELAVAPERIWMDARRGDPPPVPLELRALGARAINVQATQIDVLSAAMPAGKALGRPVFPYAIDAGRVVVETAGVQRIGVRFAPEAGSHVRRSWGVAAEMIRLASDEPGGLVYDIPVNIRYHARPVLIPGEPVAVAEQGRWRIDFKLTAGSSDERISGVQLSQARLLSSKGPRTVQAVLSTTPEGGCCLIVPDEAVGMLDVALAIAFDQPVAAAKDLQLLFRLGAPPAQAPRADAQPVPGPAVRRVRIN